MRVLVINQFFWPDSAATSQLLTDVVRGLADRGHQVTVICAAGGYAAEDLDNAPVARIVRVKSFPFMRGAIGRVLSYGSFFLTAALRGITIPRQDVVVTLTTPPLISLIGSLVQRWHQAKHFIWEMDVYPDVATDLDYFPSGGWMDRLTGLLADFSRQRCSGILALGPCMKQRLIGRGVEAEKIQIAENWADSSLIDFESVEMTPGQLRLLYSGNLGLAHEVETLMHGMKELESDGKFQFIFSGGGARRKALEQWCQTNRITHAEFTAYSSRKSLGAKLAAADIGLVTQQDRCLGSVVPSKIYGLLAAGRPVLFIGPRESTVAKVIRRFDCGWQIGCGDSEGLCRLLRTLADNPKQVVAAARSARTAFLDNYDRDAGVARVCEIIGAENRRNEDRSGLEKIRVSTFLSGAAK